jgi:hypothetical protein
VRRWGRSAGRAAGRACPWRPEGWRSYGAGPVAYGDECGNAPWRRCAILCSIFASVDSASKAKLIEMSIKLWAFLGWASIFLMLVEAFPISFVHAYFSKVLSRQTDVFA